MSEGDISFVPQIEETPDEVVEETSVHTAHELSHEETEKPDDSGYEPEEKPPLEEPQAEESAKEPAEAEAAEAMVTGAPILHRVRFGF